MQAIRVLRSQSRPASPSPAAISTNADGLAQSPLLSGAKLPLNAQIEEQQYSLSQSRPGTAMSRIQNLTAFHKRPTPTPVPSPNPVAIVQDGAYLNTLGLRLNEAATRALSAPAGTGPDVWKGKKPIPAGRGRQFAILIESELEASQGNPNLRHAILRLLPRSLSVIISNLSSQISQLVAAPGFVPTSATALPSPCTLHALGLAGLAAEILETFTVYGLGTANSDLAAIRSNFETIITQVTGPLFAQLQSEMAILVEPLGFPASGATSSPASFPGAKSTKPHVAIGTLTSQIPHLSRAIQRCSFPHCPRTQTALATLLINTIWQTLVNVTHRPVSSTYLTPVVMSRSSAVSLAHTLTPPASPPVKMKKLTPPSSPPLKKRILPLTDSPPKLPLLLRRPPSANSLGGRSNSPDVQALTGITQGNGNPMGPAQASFSAWVTSLLVDIKALYDLLASSDIPRPCEGSLAREAVDEAFDRLAAFREWLSFASSITPVNGSNMTGLERLMIDVPADIPTLLVLPVLLNGAWLERSLLIASSLSLPNALENEYLGMAKLVGYDDEEMYRRQVVCGFGRAEECELVVVQRVLERLRGANGL
ncbi:hypothetical protein FRC18_009126, partial [Serendipita sp. 400]